MPAVSRTFSPGDVTLAVLAGGDGSRMGKPKADLEVAGTPILDFLLDRFDWPGPTLLVTAPGREHPPGSGRFGREVFDPTAGEGPLRGVLTALEHAATPAVVVAAVDMPAVAREQILWLAGALGDDANCLGVMARRETADGPRVEPLPCALRAEARDVAAAALARGMRSLHGLTREAGFATLAAPAEWPERVWTNLNRPAEWAAFVAGLRGD